MQAVHLVIVTSVMDALSYTNVLDCRLHVIVNYSLICVTSGVVLPAKRLFTCWVLSSNCTCKPRLAIMYSCTSDPLSERVWVKWFIATKSMNCALPYIACIHVMTVIVYCCRCVGWTVGNC